MNASASETVARALDVFGTELETDLMHEVVITYADNARVYARLLSVALHSATLGCALTWSTRQQANGRVEA